MTKKESIISKANTNSDTKKPTQSIKKTADEHFNFEASFSELEKIVETLENGQLSLEQSLDDFERGIHLTRACQDALNNAQQKVQVLLEKNGRSSIEAFSQT